jgi:hypothetical protein
MRITRLGCAAWLAACSVAGCGRTTHRRFESSTIGDIRSLISAEAAYQSANGGYHDSPGCLAEPVRCIPGYAASAPSFLDSELASLQVKGRYVRSFHPGPPAEPEDIRRSRASTTSLQSYAYTAVPLAPDDDLRGFCGDSSGLICATRDGSAPIVQDGRCADGCTPLQ